MKTILIALTALTAFAAQAGPVDDAMTKAGCMACHAKDKKMVGPSFKDIAAKYKGKGKDVTAQLIDKVRKGGSGVWGAVPMPPNANVNDAEAKKLAAWVMSLK